MNNTITCRIAEWNVANHGIDTADGFPGHGIACTDYTHTATGCGDDPAEALDDALEQLGEQRECGLEVDIVGMLTLERDIRKAHPDFNDPVKLANASVSACHERFNPNGDDPDACSDEHDDCDHHYYLSIDLKIESTETE